MSEELKPCAHCGEKGELIDNRLGWYVSCVGCGSTVMGERAQEPETKEECEQTDWSHYERSAIQKWNTRHIPEGYIKDAARYRHLRESATFGGNQTVDLRWYLPRFGHGLSLEERLDACIDDAIRREAAE